MNAAKTPTTLINDPIDWDALHTGGMPAYEQALRALHAEYLELADRFAQHLMEHHAETIQRALPRLRLSDLETMSFADAVARTLAGREA